MSEYNANVRYDDDYADSIPGDEQDVLLDDINVPDDSEVRDYFRR